MSHNVIQIDPEILGGTPCFAGTRVPVKALFDHLKLGYSIDEFVEDFPTVERKQVDDLLEALEHELPRRVALMKLLLDENLSHRLRPLIVGHDVFSVKYLGWRGTRNGALIARAAAEGFDAIITFDSGIEYEQNLSALPCSVITLVAETSALEHLAPLVPKLLIALTQLRPKSFIKIT